MKLVPINQSPYKVLRLPKEDRVTKRLFGKRHEIKKKVILVKGFIII